MQNISYGEFNKINSINFTSEYGKLKNIKLEGSTSQSTRSGKNLLNVTAKTTTTQGLTFTVNEDKSITINGTNTGTGTYYFRIANNFALPAGDYTLSNKNPSVNNNSGFIFYDDENNFPRTNISNATFTKDTTIKPYLKVNAGVTVNNQTVYPMIIKGTYTEETLPPYEQYGASPSPDYPSEIENVEGKNKLDLSKCAFGHCTLNPNGKSITCNIVDYYWSEITTSQLNNYLLKNKGKTLTFSTGTVLSAATSIVIYGTRSDGSTYQEGYESSTGKCSITIADNFTSITSMQFRFNRKSLKYTDTSTIINYVMLEEGTVATDYVPYNSLEIRDIGENLFDCANSKIIYNNAITLYERLTNGLKIISSGGQYNMLYFLVDTVENLKGKTLTLSSDILFSKEKQYVDFGLYYTDFNGGNRKKIVTNPNITSEGKYQVTGQVEEGENRYYVCIGLRPNMDSNFAKGDYTIYDNLQVEIGETATPYTPYKEQKVTFPLSDGQKLMEGSYLASDGIHNKRKQVILDGSERWIVDKELTNTIRFYSNEFLTKGKSVNALCNYFETVSSAYTINTVDKEALMVINTTQIAVRINKTRAKTVSEFKAYLSEQYSNGTPVIVEYELAAEEIVPYTTEQQEAGDKIENFPIFIGQNNLTSTALLSAIYIKKITTDTKVDYNLYNEDYIKIATKNNIHPKFKIQMLDEYENVIDEITGDISRDNSGSISNNYQQGVRRSVSLTFIDTEGKFLPDSNSNLIWANKKFKLFSGLLDTDTNEIFWFSEGIYYFSNVSSSRNGADKLTTVNGVDKFGKFGSELGYNQLESTYLIPAGTKIYDAIKGILNIDIGNGYPIDPIEPVLDPLYIDEVCPYDISKSPSSYLSEMLIELADIIGCDIYYDADGRLHVDSGTIDSSYSNKPSIWDFSDVLPEYMNPSITTNFAEFINTVKVVGNNTNDKTYEYTAVNNNPESPTRVDLIGTKSTYIESASVYNTDRAKDYAEYKLNMFSILQLAVTFSCTFLPHLDVNKVITITDSYYKYEKQRFVIQSITLPLSYDGVMSISACNVASLPYYEGGN